MAIPDEKVNPTIRPLDTEMTTVPLDMAATATTHRAIEIETKVETETVGKATGTETMVKKDTVRRTLHRYITEVRIEKVAAEITPLRPVVEAIPQIEATTSPQVEQNMGEEVTGTDILVLGNESLGMTAGEAGLVDLMDQEGVEAGMATEIERGARRLNDLGDRPPISRTLFRLMCENDD